LRRIVVTSLAAAMVAALAAPAGAAPPTDRGRPADAGRSADAGRPADAGPPDAPGGFSIEVLSSRPEYVSGGDARIAIEVPSNVPRRTVRVRVDDEPAQVDLEPVSDTRLEGVIEDLPLGTSTIRVTPGPARVEVTNHPVSGPMFSGPHQEPFYCQTETAGLGPALDEDCFAETRVEFRYRRTTGGFGVLPEGERPADLATTTTTTGDTVDYIVRLETGVINRAVYQTAVLYDPDVDDTDAPGATPGWNGRLVYTYGGGCNAAYAQGAGNGGVLNDLHLSRGFATASSSLNVLNNECNDVVSAETTSMVKERFIVAYGADVHTIGWGGSGGAISQYLIAHNYPGLLDGIVPTLTYPDATSIFPGIGDCRLMNAYFDTAPALWDLASRTAVAGHYGWDNCLSWAFSFANRADATTACNPIVPRSTWYHPDTNPDGVRCSVSDNAVNVLGIDPETGFAPQADDNLGVQYGLNSLNAGDITVEQFLAINRDIDGFDGDGVITDGRQGPSPVIDRFYSTGRITTGTGLATVPIINVRPYTDQVADIHTRYYTFNTRERLLRDNGTAANQAVQVYGLATPPAVVAQIQANALVAMDEWLTAIGTDTLERTAEEVIAARPDSALDGCWDAAGTLIREAPSFDGDTACNELYPVHADPRYEAGGPLTGDVLSCQLEPLDPDDYTVEFTADQWAQLEAAFPQGVCDWDQPGTGQGTWAGPWQSFGSG
jgi:hypothetical protein